MCERGTTTEVIIDGKSISIDSCIAERVRTLNEMRGIKTLGSCCGHGIYPSTIICLEIYSGDVFEGCGRTTTSIPRKRNFYRRDANGIYYLPEVVKKETEEGC
jgi:hypothetical protein